MATVMMTIHAPGGEPGLPEIMKKYGLAQSEIDQNFGVVPLGNDDYTILVESSAAHKISPDTDWDTEGPYSNPKIEPFGLQ
jgi:hypothetical protein